ARLQEFGADEGDELIVSREIQASGRSLCRLNSRPVPVSSLREVGALLIDLHGQHQHYSLLRPSSHLQTLDRYAGADHLARLARYGEVHRRWLAARAELEGLRAAERQRQREIDWLNHEIAEIEAAAPRPGEEEELAVEVGRLAAAEALLQGAEQARALLVEEGGAFDPLARAGQVLRPLRLHDDRLGPLVERLQEAEVLVSEAARELSRYAQRVQADPGRLQELQERQETLARLRRKYGATLEEVLGHLERSRARRDELGAAGRRTEELEGALEALEEEQRGLAAELSRERRQAAGRLQHQVAGELSRLGLEKCRLEVLCEPLAEPGPEGADRVELLICPNPGEPLRPLARIASGGELSRIMLALMSLLWSSQGVPTMVFDEIDAGLGGRAAEAVARRLRDLACHCQVLCVTHLAVLAAAGDRHYRLHKETHRGRTRTVAQALEGSLREAEVARMLSGDASPQAALSHARELLGARHGS
ncbi:MAG TPA: DNA repair protein RecN, partial [Candidatus Nitrosotenuis sp.]|nr:DNA repair protein RecN [Candidatus Nitrosotenuis sp.]